MSSLDQNTGKIFRHYKNNKLYRYLFIAATKDNRSALVVVYQDIESNLIFTRPLNFFNGSVKGVARFKEEE